MHSKSQLLGEYRPSNQSPTLLPRSNSVLFRKKLSHCPPSTVASVPLVGSRISSRSCLCTALRKRGQEVLFEASGILLFHRHDYGEGGGETPIVSVGGALHTGKWRFISVKPESRTLVIGDTNYWRIKTSDFTAVATTRTRDAQMKFGTCNQSEQPRMGQVLHMILAVRLGHGMFDLVAVLFIKAVFGAVPEARKVGDLKINVEAPLVREELNVTFHCCVVFTYSCGYICRSLTTIGLRNG